jgi:hypothetical protein
MPYPSALRGRRRSRNAEYGVARPHKRRGPFIPSLLSSMEERFMQPAQVDRPDACGPMRTSSADQADGRGRVGRSRRRSSPSAAPCPTCSPDSLDPHLASSIPISSHAVLVRCRLSPPIKSPSRRRCCCNRVVAAAAAVVFGTLAPPAPPTSFPPRTPAACRSLCRCRELARACRSPHHLHSHPLQLVGMSPSPASGAHEVPSHPRRRRALAGEALRTSSLATFHLVRPSRAFTGIALRSVADGIAVLRLQVRL